MELLPLFAFAVMALALIIGVLVINVLFPTDENAKRRYPFSKKRNKESE